jgi:hypothetical protein
VQSEDRPFRLAFPETFAMRNRPVTSAVIDDAPGPDTRVRSTQDLGHESVHLSPRTRQVTNLGAVNSRKLLIFLCSGPYN